MARLGLEKEIVDRSAYERTLRHLKTTGVRLPTFAELADPTRIPAEVRGSLAKVDPDTPHPQNLFRVNWYNDASRRGYAAVPEHLVLPEALTGVPAKIIVVLGNRFPMIRAHKVLAAYACLAPRVATGQFDPTTHRAVWPSTGNYCRGGVAISRILGCRGVAVLPEGMSEERFRWLGAWVADPADVVKTPGCESNVKEIYDKCAELDREPSNIIFNQFCEFANHLAHYAVTGRALAAVYEAARVHWPRLALRAFSSATGSAGTIGAGDYLKDQYGTKIVAAEALECPTMLANGFGDHNIQGIGDKHIPLIHNVMNTDVVVAVSDHATDGLDVVFNTDAGREYLTGRRGVPRAVVEGLGSLGLSSICNVLAAVKTAKRLSLGEDDAIITIATDGADMYGSERAKTLAARFARGFDAVAAGEVFERHLAGAGTDNVLELTHEERCRIFNLGYFTWVEQQGVSLADFESRRSQTFWKGLRALLPAWDQLIVDMNGRARA